MEKVNLLSAISICALLAFAARVDSASINKDGLIVEASDVNEATSRTRAYRSFKGNAFLHNTIPNATRKVDLFLTPSCTYCIELYNGIFRPGAMSNSGLDRTNFFIFLVPRLNQDHQTIKNLMCVPEGAFPAAVHKYFKEMVGWGRRAGDRLTQTHDVSESIAKLLGATDDQIAACQQNAVYDRVILESWKTGWNINSRKEWPLVVIDDRATHIETASDLFSTISQ